MKKTKTYGTKLTDVKRNWFLVDAKGKVLGRLGAKVAEILRGKHKAIYSPHLDTGDFVVVINAKDIAITGKKEKEKYYFTHSGYMGGGKFRSLSELREKHPEKIIIHAVRGMLPRGPLGDKMINKLKVYAGLEHPHKEVKPVKLEV